MAVALIAVAAIALAYMALSGVHIGGPASGSVPAQISESSESSEPVATPVPVVPAPQPVSVALVSDLDGNVAGSWWAQSVSTGAVAGVQAGPVASQTDSFVETLTQLLDNAAVPAGGYVVVQAGTPELADGQDPAEVLLSVQSLWAGVRDRGGIPIAALVPPSDDEPEAIVQFNELLRAAAATQTVPVLDIYTAVAAADGSWAPGFSDDGVQVSAAGSTAMAQAVVAQLPALVVPTP